MHWLKHIDANINLLILDKQKCKFMQQNMFKNLSVLALAFNMFISCNHAEPVRIVKEASGAYQLIVDGEPFFAKGVGGTKNLSLLKELGGNTFRTWGIQELSQEVDGKPLIDHAHDLGLKVMAGIWIGHERHGFDYSDRSQLKQQREAVREAVRRYRNHPALLAWGLGNEMEGPQSDGRSKYIWEELNKLAQIIKSEDSDHPVVTIIAGLGGEKVPQIIKYYPEIDILGVNAYASAPAVASELNSLGWEKPFMLTEFGPIGHWEVPKTSWGAPIEANSREKAATYYVTHRRVVDEGQGKCLGTFAFYWANKQECTSTWYGMFLPTGERLNSADAMSYAWTGSFPENRAPRLRQLESAAAMQRIRAGSVQTAKAVVQDASDDYKYRWVVVAESTDRKVGGDRENAPPEYPELIQSQSGNEVTFTAPKRSGAYRLFVFITTPHNAAATANFPFYVN